MDDRGTVTVDEVLTMRKAIGWGLPSRAVMQMALSNSLAVVVRRDDDGVLTGFCRAVGDGVLYVVLVDVMVRPDHQRRGLGAGMVTELLETVSRRAPIVLIAAAEVQPFYERLGFRVQLDKLMRLH